MKPREEDKREAHWCLLENRSAFLSQYHIVYPHWIFYLQKKVNGGDKCNIMVALTVCNPLSSFCLEYTLLIWLKLISILCALLIWLKLISILCESLQTGLALDWLFPNKEEKVCDTCPNPLVSFPLFIVSVILVMTKQSDLKNTSLDSKRIK